MAIGVMSGTSLDGLDAVLLAYGAEGRYRVTQHCFHPWPDELRTMLIGLAEGQAAPAAVFAEALRGISEAYAAIIREVLKRAGCAKDEVAVVGMHGQTVFHKPAPDGVTWQMGWPSWVAARTGISVAADFRVADVARGGQGAPLAPLAHQAFFSHPVERRGVLNLGGIANLTVLDRGGAIEAAFDTGPANMILDGLVEDATGGEERMDRDGALAAQGRVDTAVLNRLLTHPFFQLPPPKSTGRETFGRAYRKAFAGMALPDALATAVALTAGTITDQMARYRLDRVIVAGGGARNPALMRAITARAGCPVEPSDAYGIAPDALEGASFAWLGMATLAGRAHDLGTVTGGPAGVLGVLARP
jgi:anhydro-N-acetylmuramic acid kinase